MKLNDVIKHFGDEREAAYRLGYSVQAIHHWKNNKMIPDKAQRLIESVTNGTLKAKARKPSQDNAALTGAEGVRVGGTVIRKE